MIKDVYSIFAVVLTLFIVGCQDNADQYGQTDRPDNFPADVYPIENALDISYAVPDEHKIAKGVWSLSYSVKDGYPAEDTVQKIREQMQSNGYVRVSWVADDYSVKVKGNGTEEEDQQMREELTKTIREGFGDGVVNKSEWKQTDLGRKAKGYISYEWKEEWVSASEDLVDVILFYMYPEGKEDLGQVFVQISVFTPSSWRCPYVKRYKELHPDAFK